jgi:tetratricopeptide (TPR) repeat protein
MSSEKSIFERFFPIIFLLTIGICFVSQVQYDTWRRFGTSKIKINYNEYIEPQPLSRSIVKAASLGAYEFMADYYWLQFIQYYGGGDPYGKYRKLPDLFNAITELSPRFSEAYKTGLIVMPGEGFVEEALALGKKGETNLPNSWEMPYYTGLVHHIYKKDYIAAAEHFKRAASLPNSPAITKLFVGIYYKEASQREMAYAIFKTVYETSPEGYVKERAGKYLNHLAGMFFLQDSVITFKERYNRFPFTLNELVEKKITDQIPISPLSIDYSYDPQSGLVGEVKK